MKKTGGQIVARALEDEGITFTFGIPGTHNIELYDALAASRTVRPVLVTDEQSASFMADGAWRASGRMACVNVVPGAGLTHALSGIAEAFMDNVPMLVLGCGIRRDSGKAFQLHDVDQMAMVGPVVKATYRPERGEELYATIREACAVAREGAPGPVFVEVPANLYLSRHDVAPPARDAPDGSGSHEAPAGTDRVAARAPVQGPAEALLERAASMVRASERPLLYIGAGALGARDEIIGLAEDLEAPVSTTFQGKGVFPEDHPLFLWPGFGQAAPRFVRDVVEDRDLTLAIGCRFSEVGTGSYGLEPRGRLIHVDIDPDVLGRNFQADAAVVSDAAVFVRALKGCLGDLSREPDAALRDRIRMGHARIWEEWLAEVGGAGVTPAHLLRSLQRIMGPDTVFTTDSGNGTFLAMECLRLESPRSFLAPVDYSCMGYAVPSAIGAKLQAPERPVVALAGDGAFLMTGLECLTAGREGLGVTVLVLRDHELAQIAQFQATAMNRKVASALPPYDLEPLARALGVAFLSMPDDDAVEDALVEADRLTGEGRPVLVDAAIDYSRKTYFTKGVIRTTLNRLPVREQARFVGRALLRRVMEPRA